MDYVTLLGVEQVQSAASTMQHAASDIQRAVGHLESTLMQQQRSQDDLLNRLELILQEDRVKRGLPA